MGTFQSPFCKQVKQTLTLAMAENKQAMTFCVNCTTPITQASQSVSCSSSSSHSSTIHSYLHLLQSLYGQRETKFTRIEAKQVTISKAIFNKSTPDGLFVNN